MIHQVMKCNEQKEPTQKGNHRTLCYILEKVKTMVIGGDQKLGCADGMTRQSIQGF